jgi:hypothetical protein
MPKGGSNGKKKSPPATNVDNTNASGSHKELSELASKGKADGVAETKVSSSSEVSQSIDNTSGSGISKESVSSTPSEDFQVGKGIGVSPEGWNNTTTGARDSKPVEVEDQENSDQFSMNNPMNPGPVDVKKTKDQDHKHAHVPPILGWKEFDQNNPMGHQKKVSSHAPVGKNGDAANNKQGGQKVLKAKTLSPGAIGKVVSYHTKPKDQAAGVFHLVTFVACGASSLLLYTWMAVFEFAMWASFQWGRSLYYLWSTCALLFVSGVVMWFNFVKAIGMFIATSILSVVVLLLNRLPGQSYSVPKVLNGKGV